MKLVRKICILLFTSIYISSAVHYIYIIYIYIYIYIYILPKFLSNNKLDKNLRNKTTDLIL